MAMKYYPVFLDIKDKDCLVIGGGAVGVRKALTLEKCGARVKVVSDRFSAPLEGLRKSSVCLEEKKYDKEDLKGMFLVFAATNNADLNQEIKKEASRLHIVCNVADDPDSSDFILPSTVERGDLIVAVSTSGSSPAMAKKIRQELEIYFGPEYEEFLLLMGNIRKQLLLSGHAPDEHKKIFHALIERGGLKLIREKNEIKINKVLSDILGGNYSYQDLVIPRSNE